jgi:membrane protease YdiL (CAAX protease family)
MTVSLAVIAGVALAATAVSLAPLLSWEVATSRAEWLPDEGTANTHGRLTVVLVFAAAVLFVVPGAPAVHWAVPDAIGAGLVVVTPLVLMMVGTVVAVTWSVFGVEPTDTAFDEGLTADNLLWLVSPALLVGPAEELLFRGLVQGLLVDGVGLVPGILGMSVLFGVYHFPNVSDSLFRLDTSDVAQLSLSASGGLVFGAFYVSTGNLLVPILGHSLHVGLLYVYSSRQNDAPIEDTIPA